jgi:transcriptional regulator with XRE-family HTH domain
MKRFRVQLADATLAGGMPETVSSRGRMDQPRNPVADRRELVATLRGLREVSGLSLDDAARRAMVGSGAKLSRIETGKQLAAPRDVRDLAQLYDLDAERTAHLMALAVSAREPGLIDAYDVNLDDYVDLEAAATRIEQFENSVVPGLLQTRDYTREYIGTVLGSVRLQPQPAHEVDEIVEIWDRRQQRLRTATEVSFVFVLDEAALRRPYGGPRMQDQIQHIRDVSDYPNVHLHVLPLSKGGSPGQQGGFSLLTLPDEVPDVVYVESLVGFELLDTPDELARFRRRFDVIHESCPDESHTHEELARIAGDLAAAASPT